VGKDFYSELSEYLRAKKNQNFDSLSLKEKINTWLSYDSSSGMGKFIIENFSYNPPELTGIIKVSPAFTVDENTPHNLCNFLSGYIAGVFTSIIGFEVKVQEESCGRNNAERICTFRILKK